MLCSVGLVFEKRKGLRLRGGELERPVFKIRVRMSCMCGNKLIYLFQFLCVCVYHLWCVSVARAVGSLI
jgi:hypothetical protein